MLEIAAFYLSDKLSKIIEDENNKEIYTYGLEIILNALISYLLIIIMGALTGELIATVFYLICYSGIRLWAGGYHAKTHLRCILIFAFVYIFSIFVLKIFVRESSCIFYILFIDNFVIGLLAPASALDNPIPNTKVKELKMRSIVVSSALSIVIYYISFYDRIMAEYGVLGISCMTVLLVFGKIQYLIKKGENKNEKIA